MKDQEGRPRGGEAPVRRERDLEQRVTELEKQVVTLAVEWFKTPSCGVFAADLDGQVSPLASRGLGTALSPAALEIARWVLLRGRTWATVRRNSSVVAFFCIG